MQFAQTIENIVKQRTSVRTYHKSSLEPEKENTLKKFLASQSTGPFQSKMRFRLITANPTDGNALKGLGTYGFIKNPAGFIVGAVEASGSKFLEDFGFVMERIILGATDLGLGTCWVGGSFQKSRFAEAMALNEREIVPAVTPLGNPAAKKSLRDSLLRKGKMSSISI
jgi:nitroreductase